MSEMVGRRKRAWSVAVGCLLVGLCASLLVSCSKGRPGELSGAGPMLDVVPAGATLKSESKISGDGGPLGQNAVPTVLRRFTPKPGVTQASLVEELDAAAAENNLEVSVRRDGHCAVRRTDDGWIVFTWTALPRDHYVLLRAAYERSTRSAEDTCKGSAGPVV